MRHLLLTLGHGSSAILIDNNKIVCGFENERITGIKSDSKFPSEAIEEIEKFYSLNGADIHISHWFLNGQLTHSEWYDSVYMENKFPDSTIYSVNASFTHHDAHAESAKLFARSTNMHNASVLVADGFGTYGEVITLYGPEEDGSQVLDRVFGFDKSIGLMYQYATAYLDLKMNQDEYKLLGFESHINELDIDLSPDIRHLSAIMSRSISRGFNSAYDPVVSIDALTTTRLAYNRLFDAICDKHKIYGMDHKRILIARLVQGVTEAVILWLLESHNIQDVILVGGVFMNVKLNNAIAKLLRKTCIMPLCGDSGAALGVYAAVHGSFKWPGDVFWGKREAWDDATCDTNISPGLSVLPPSKAVEVIRTKLKLGYIINLVDGNMEFGPRALGHTSTLALPTMDNVDYINKCNSRASIMPMAGVCRDDVVEMYHDDVDDIEKSMEYMVCTRDFLPYVTDVRGASHPDPDSQKYTGRTQVVHECTPSLLYDILAHDIPMLINTSFNPHGSPIVYSRRQIINAHNRMKSKDDRDLVITIVVER